MTKRYRTMFVVQGNYSGFGWEDLYEDTSRNEAHRILREYAIGNQGVHRILVRKEEIVGNENMAAQERRGRPTLAELVPDALRRHWSETGTAGMRALSAFAWRLRATQKMNYNEVRRIFIDRGIVVDEPEFETLMMELDEFDAAAVR